MELNPVKMWNEGMVSITSEETVALAMDLNPVENVEWGNDASQNATTGDGQHETTKEKNSNVTLTKTVFDFETIVHLSALHISTRDFTHLALGTIGTWPRVRCHN